MSETMETAAPEAPAEIGAASTPAPSPEVVNSTESAPATAPEPSQEHAPKPQEPAPEQTQPGDKKTDKAELSFEQEPSTEPTKPEPIAYDFKVPEGTEIAQDKLSAFTQIANEARLPPETAQKMLDQHLSVVKEMQDNAVAANAKYWDDKSTEFKAQAAADKEYGGQGYASSVKLMVAGRNQLVPQQNAAAFDNLLSTYPGLQYHPEFRRMLYHAGQKWQNGEEAKMALNARPNPSPQRDPGKNLFTTLYPSTAGRQDG